MTPQLPRLLRPVLIVGGYLVAFILLESVATVFEYVEQTSLRETSLLPWHLSAGLSLALLLTCGLRYAPAIFLAPIVSGLWLHPETRTSVLVLAALNTSIGYTLGTFALRRALGVDPCLRRVRDVISFLWVAVIASLLVTAFVVADLAVFSMADLPGMFPVSDHDLARFNNKWLPNAIRIFVWWIADAIGILVVTPFLLVHGIPAARAAIRRLLSRSLPRLDAAQFRSRQAAIFAGQSLLVAVGLYLLSRLSANQDLLRAAPIPLALAFLPLIWLTLRHGLSGATAAVLVLNLGATWMLLNIDTPVRSVTLTIQFLMLALSLTGLFLGGIVSERKQVEAAMENALRRRAELEAIVNRSPMVVFLWKATEGWPVEFVSDNIRQFGFTPDEFLSGQIAYNQIVHSEDRERVGTEIAKFSAEGPALFTREYRILTKNGDVRWIDDRTWVSRDASGAITHYQGVLIDITERKWAEDKLHRSEERIRLLLQGVKDYAIFMLSPHGKVASWNEGAERIKGYNADEIIGQNFSKFYTETDLRNETPQKHLEIAMRNGSFEDEDWRVRKDGSRFWANMILTVLRDEKGKARGFSNVTRDVTERKQAEEQLRQAKEAAEAASHAKSEFVATISHELRAPVNEVIGHTGLLLDTDLTMEQRECATTVKSSAHNLLAVINTILDLAKIEAGKMPVEPTPFDLRTTAEEAVEMLTPAAQQKNLEFELHYAPGAPNRVLGDSGHIRQIFVNLADNAIKFTSKGKVGIHVDCQEKTEKEALFRISVQDTGIGIPDDKQSLLFEKFTQLDAATKRQYGGIGLGLAISKKLVELMGGAVGMTSRQGEGSTFWFTLRLPLDQNAPADSSLRTEATPSASIFFRCRVLLAEDNMMDQRVAIGLLEKLGCRVDVAANGIEAVAMFDKLPYDLVFMDCQMTEMDGCEATAEIRRRHTGGKRVPVIAITSTPPEEIRDQCLQSGMDDLVAKPLHLPQLAELIEKWKQG